MIMLARLCNCDGILIVIYVACPSPKWLVAAEINFACPVIHGSCSVQLCTFWQYRWSVLLSRLMSDSSKSQYRSIADVIIIVHKCATLTFIMYLNICTSSPFFGIRLSSAAGKATCVWTCVWECHPLKSNVEFRLTWSGNFDCRICALLICQY